jgi:ABC-type transport system involved in multi-copper enzyme maturation permease subunit
MPVFEQGYRRYVGERSTGSRVLPIAWENVRPRMRWWCWLLLFALSFAPYLLHAVFIFISTIGAAMFGESPMAAVPVSNEAFGNESQFSPQAVLGVLQGNPFRLHWNLLQYSASSAVVFTSVVGAGLLASDRRTGGLQIYFSRPVSLQDYLLGKIVAACAIHSLITIVPCFLLWLESIALAPVSSFTWRTWVAPLSLAGTSTLYALWTVSLLLFFSSAMRRPAFVAIATIFVHGALEVVGEVLANTLDKSWHVIQPRYATGTLTAPLCGVTIPGWIDPVAAFGIGFVLPLALLGFAAWRVRAVEVST